MIMLNACMKINQLKETKKMNRIFKISKNLFLAKSSQNRELKVLEIHHLKCKALNNSTKFQICIHRNLRRWVLTTSIIIFNNSNLSIHNILTFNVRKKKNRISKLSFLKKMKRYKILDQNSRQLQFNKLSYLPPILLLNCHLHLFHLPKFLHLITLH